MDGRIRGMQNTSFSLLLTYQKQYPIFVRQAANYIKEYLNKTPEFAIVLGSGLGDIAQQIDVKEIIPYSEIPNFPDTSVPGHSGELIIGTLENRLVIGLKGRRHYYEGATLPLNIGILQTVFAVHVLAELGIPNYFVTNAAGGLNSKYRVGDLMLIKSHINLLPNPLLGKHYSFTRVDNGEATYRFQPMNEAYNKDLIKKFLDINKKFSRNIHSGTYLAVTGPTYETEAECIAFRDGLKADAVGMSTTPEVIVARNRGMNVIGFSCITNKIAKNGTNATNHEEVKSILESSEVKERITRSVVNFFKSLND